MAAFGFLTMVASAASAETRSLKLYFVHTGEKKEITFKRNGRFDPAGLADLNRFLRDWRRNEPTKMDPRLFDLIWEAYRASGSHEYIHVVSAYRSPTTNSMLRSRSKMVAEKSQHMLGKAMDFYLPDVPLKRMREIGLKMQAGGVGYYPTSGSPFVHFDVGNVRHWPRMSRQELVALFPNGKTLHVPSDGKPLPGFEEALAAYEARKGSGGELAVAMASGGSKSTKRSGGLLAALFGGGGSDDEEDSAPVVASAAPAPKAITRQVPAATVVAAPAKGGIQILSPDEAQRAEIPGVDAAEPQPAQAPETIVAALPARGVPLPALAPRPKGELGNAVAVAEAAPETVPFGMAQDPLQGTPGAQAQAVALNIPLPTHRPDYTPPAEPAKPTQQEAMLLALAETDKGKLANIPLPVSRPTTVSESSDMVVAALPQARPTLPEPAKVAQPDEAAAVQAEIKASKERMAALATAAAEPAAMVADVPVEPVAPTSGAKTTPKTARAAAQDAKPDRKSVTLAAAPDAARWVLHKDYVAKASEGTTAPSFAYNIVRTAPREVYTAGFQKGSQVADASRFTGKAVQFLSVARFETN
ncbi:DUF882 domain-containing protein [Pseudaminobacter soli (ex Li et al. 2025)]|uniref:Murein endopeptidase K n=1 Tax=Pseudaminobacter soli (ex Li et al. 2025) TaxID=1295366 RepID=A0A2P7SEW2_9HYPH|nr:DUF882 domain-containing protein [Mesorhizobium soli]PSJ61000.1 peptidase M15 [Mesorhizobium soli]